MHVGILHAYHNWRSEYWRADVPISNVCLTPCTGGLTFPAPHPMFAVSNGILVGALKIALQNQDSSTCQLLACTDECKGRSFKYPKKTLTRIQLISRGLIWSRASSVKVVKNPRYKIMINDKNLMKSLVCTR